MTSDNGALKSIVKTEEVTVAASLDITERDFVLLLISLYKSYPELWKVKDKDYVDKNKRAIALQAITESLRVYKPTYTEELLKKKINALRTNFNKEKNKIKKGKRFDLSADGLPKPALWYYNEMLFLSDQKIKSDSDNSEQSSSYENVVPLKDSKITTELMGTATEYKFKRPRCDSDVIAKSWAIKLNRLKPDQRSYAEKIINDVLFEGALGTLSRNGVHFLPADSTSN